MGSYFTKETFRFLDESERQKAEAGRKAGAGAKKPEQGPKKGPGKPA